MAEVDRKQISNVVLEGVSYITLPSSLKDVSVSSIKEKVKTWRELDVDLHVFDFKATQVLNTDCMKELKIFADNSRQDGRNVISVNMSEPLFREVKKLGFEASFNRIVNFPGDLNNKKKLTETEIKRLLFKYLAKGSFAAVEVSLNSTLACDENYSAKPDEVPLEQFDLISIINVNTAFLQAEFRLLGSNSVMEKLARASLPNVVIDGELMESMSMELLNMIYGFAKSNLNSKEGFDLPTAIPKILRKSEFHRVQRSGPGNITIMPMVTPMGSFYIEVDFGKKSMPKVHTP